jgi:Kef-type K+ transport system membrane component KefB
MSSTNPDRLDREGLGGKFWLAVLGIAIACGIGCVIAFVLFGLAWAAWGLIGAVIALLVLAAVVSWVMDRRARRRWS